MLCFGWRQLGTVPDRGRQRRRRRLREHVDPGQRCSAQLLRREWWRGWLHATVGTAVFVTADVGRGRHGVAATAAASIFDRSRRVGTVLDQVTVVVLERAGRRRGNGLESGNSFAD